MNVICGTRFLKIFIHILDDNSLINMFYHCRPVLLDDDEANDLRILQGGKWDREYWWYKLVQVCRRWRYLVFRSVFHLGLCLRCTNGTPVADMLEHSPPLPLVIDYYIDGNRGLSEEDEKGIMLALQHRDRVRRIRLLMPHQDLQKFIAAIGKEFPMLEFLYLSPLIDNDTGLKLPETFQAPHLRHLALCNFAFPMVSSSFAPIMGLVTLSLDVIPPSANFCPNSLLQWVSRMPELRTLGVTFYSQVPNHDVERQLSDISIVTHVTLPNLRWFGFDSAYLGALLPWITTPLLDKLQVYIFNQLTDSLPNLKQFISSAHNLRYSCARLRFDENSIGLWVYPREGTSIYALYMRVYCRGHDWQVSSAAQVCSVLSQVFSTVVDLTLLYGEHASSSEPHSEAVHIPWRGLLRSFNNARTLRLPNRVLAELSCSLQVRDGESPVDLLPELKELQYDASEDDPVDAFAAFIDARENAGCPVTLVRH
jgi:hypothetical protein